MPTAVINGRVKVIRSSLVTRVYVRDETNTDGLVNAFLPYEGKNVKVTIEELI